MMANHWSEKANRPALAEAVQAKRRRRTGQPTDYDVGRSSPPSKLRPVKVLPGQLDLDGHEHK
jgi:hypothetical protein